jgi:deoxyribodipyrimidine photolyase-related protein
MNFLFFPHQLVLPRWEEEVPSNSGSKGKAKAKPRAWLVEEFLFFRHYAFHRQKLIYQRACMLAFADELAAQGWEVCYVDSTLPWSDIRDLIPHARSSHGITQFRCYEPSDYWLRLRLLAASEQTGIKVEFLDNPLFMDRPMDATSWFTGRKRFLQADYYRKQRQARGILTDPLTGEPAGGQWSFDADNRKSYPARSSPPPPPTAKPDHYWTDAQEFTNKHYPHAPGQAVGDWTWPVTRTAAKAWLQVFLKERFAGFGPYEDALDTRFSLLHHSGLSPMLNNGLLSPRVVLEQCLEHARNQEIPLASLEGFVRQLLGWREFVHGVYLHAGNRQRRSNFWGHTKPMPPGFYTAQTGIAPVDHVLRKMLENAYNHHIERLMVLSNFMLLCEIHPNAVYRWFMEMYIDAYDWVMVPNVYGMGQFADGGLLSTKPYLSSSNYLLKMSNFSPDPAWTQVWDALYWRFVSKNAAWMLRNPRSAMMVRLWEKKDPSAQVLMLQRAENFLLHLHQS